MNCTRCDAGYPNTFTNCERGIITSSASAAIAGCQFYSTGVGIYHTAATGTTIDDHDNIAKDVFLGVTVVGGDPAAMKIHDNVLGTQATVPYTSGSFSILQPIVINTRFATVTGTHYSIASNLVAVNSSTGTGIYVSKGGGALHVEDNVVQFTSSTTPNLAAGPPLEGIHMQYCVGTTELHHNSVQGTTATLAATPPTGGNNGAAIILDQSAGMIVDCNATTRFPYGFLVLGNCGTATDQDFRTNDIGNHNIGILLRHLGAAGTLGTQIGNANNDNNNVWSGLGGSGSGYQTIGGNQEKIFAVMAGGSPSCIAGARQIYTTASTTTLYASESQSSTTNCQYYVSLPNSGANVEPSCATALPKMDDSDEGNYDMMAAMAVAIGSADYPEFAEVAQWTAEKNLYKTLNDDSSLMTGNATLSSFHNAKQTTPIEDIRYADAKNAGLADSLIAADPNLYAAQLAAAQAAQQAASYTNLAEENEKLVNALYLRIVAEGTDSLSDDDTAFICGLARSCPLVNGTAVYKARSLYGLWYAPPSWDDIALCNNAGSANRGGNPGPGIFDAENAVLTHLTNSTVSSWKAMISPNPTTGKIQISFTPDYAPGDEAYVEFTDAFGRQVLQVKLQPAAGIKAVDLGNQLPGIYYYRILVNGQQNDAGKLLIMR